MPESMTGFGAGRATGDGVDVRAELRSVNHRHLDLRFKLPPELSALQPKLTAAVRAHLDRGHVEVRVHVARDAAVAPEIRLDLPLAQAWHGALTALADAVGLSAPDDLRMLVSQPGVATVARPEEALERVEPLVLAAVTRGTEALLARRLVEGASLAVDIRGRLDHLRAIHAELEAEAPAVLAYQRERLQTRVDKALANAAAQVDPSRLEQEVVLLSDKSDITEELVRLAGHFDAAERALATPRPGRQLGFLAQEILREFNTTGSKSNALAVTERVVAAKVEIEKIREQVLNLA